MYSETDFRGLFMKIQINQFQWTSLFLLSFSVPLLSFCFVFLSTNLTALSSFRTSFAFWRKKTDQTIFNKIIYQMLSYCLSCATKYPKNHFPFHWRYRCTKQPFFSLVPFLSFSQSAKDYSRFNVCRDDKFLLTDWKSRMGRS